MVKNREGPSASFSTKSRYRIFIYGALKECWSEWFNGFDISIDHSQDQPPFTILTCPAIDQARLRGILNRIWDLNLSLYSVLPISDPMVESS
jgi:hypothetical protein